MSLQLLVDELARFLVMGTYGFDEAQTVLWWSNAGENEREEFRQQAHRVLDRIVDETLHSRVSPPEKRVVSAP
jgi:hypothetical protein